MGSLKKAAKNFGGNRGRWDEAFKDDQFPIPSKATRIRLFNEVETVPTHWVEFYSKKQKGQTGFYALCINHNYETGETVDNGCPYCKAGFRVSNYVYGYVISRRDQRKGALQVKPIRLTPKCTNDILRLTEVAYPDEEWPEGWSGEDGEGPDATHPKFGFDITIAKITKNKKTEYEVHVADGGKIALKKSEFQAFKAYAEQMPFGELAKAGLESKAEIDRKLQELGITGEGGGGGGGGKSTNYEDYDSIDDDEEGGGDDEEGGDDEDPATAAPPKKSGSKKKAAASKKPKATKVESLTDDDGEEGDDRDLPWDDEDGEEDEEMETSYSDPDEEDAPEDDEEYEDDED